MVQWLKLSAVNARDTGSISSHATLLFSHSGVSDSLQPMDCRTVGFLVLHHLSEFAQTHVH